MKYCDGEMERLGFKELRHILVATSTIGASAPHSSSSKDKDTEDEVKLSSCCSKPRDCSADEAQCLACFCPRLPARAIFQIRGSVTLKCLN